MCYFSWETVSGTTGMEQSTQELWQDAPAVQFLKSKLKVVLVSRGALRAGTILSLLTFEKEVQPRICTNAI